MGYKEDLQGLISELGPARIAATEAKARVQNMENEALEAVRSKGSYMAALGESTSNTERVADLESMIRDIALMQYKETGDKKPAEGVVIKLFKTVKVSDPARVREWTLKNLVDAMTPDMKKVEKYASEIGPVDGIETGEEARAQIATRL